MYVELQLPREADPERFLLELGRGDVPFELQEILDSLTRRILYRAYARQARGRDATDPWSVRQQRSQAQRGTTTLNLEPIRISDVDLPHFRRVRIVERNLPAFALTHAAPGSPDIVPVDGTAFRVAEQLAQSGPVMTFVSAPIREFGRNLGHGGTPSYATAAASFDFRPDAKPFECAAVKGTLDERARSAWLGTDGGRSIGSATVGLHFSHSGFDRKSGMGATELPIRTATPAWMGPQGVFVAAKPEAKPEAEPEPEEILLTEVVAEPEPAPAPEECGGIDDLTVSCKHNGRGLGPARKLQIVAANPLMEQFKIGAKDDRPDPSRRAPRSFSIGFKRSRPGGNDELTCTVSSLAPAPCGQQHVAMLRTAGSPSDSDETSSPVTVLPPDNTDLWTRRDPPDVYHLYGKCCGDWSRHATVESYPAKRYEFFLFVGDFRSIFAAPQKWLEAKIPWYKHEAAPAIAAKAKGRRGPVAWELSLMEPEGKFEAKMGWKEDDDWRAYHELEVAASLNVLAGVKIEFTLSLAYIAATAALSSLGVPPPVSAWLAEKGIKYLADVWVSADLQIKLFIGGSLADRYYPAGGGSEKVGTVDGGLEGAFTVGIAARLGGDSWVSVTVKGKGTVKLAIGDTLTIDSSGIQWNPAVKAPPILLAVSFVAKVARFTAVDSHSQWSVSKAKTLWEPDQPWQLFDFDRQPVAAP